MKEAIGGVFSLEFIIVFLLLLNGYLAFNVNYTKAFRVKNEIRSIIQKNEGLTESAMDDIGNYMQKTNYHQNTQFNDWCTKKGYYVCDTGVGKFCMEVASSDKYGTRDGKNIAAYYTVYTFVDINIPVLNNLLPALGGLFVVSGETSLIYTAETSFNGGEAMAGITCTGNPIPQ